MRKLFSVLSSTLQVRGGLLLLLLVASVSAIYASNTKVGGIWYDFDSSTKTASVTYRGSESVSYEGEYSGSVTIPETVTYNGTTYSVTSIGDYAFDGCTSLTSVTIPNSVISIGDYAFGICFSLTSVTIPNSVTSIGDYAFYWCSSLTSPVYNAHCFAYMPTSYSGAYTIPAGIEQIAGGAFESCSSLTSVTIPNSVISIGDYAFENCSSLTSVTIPNSVTSIGNSAFKDCSSLTSLTIPNSVTSIGNYAFEDCSSLTSVTIPNSVTSIGNSAFKDCIFTKDNFINHSTLDAEVNNYWGATIVVGDEINGLFIRNDTVIHCRKYVTSVEIPNSVTSIGEYAFSGCKSLPTITIPNSVTSIGYYAFSGCSSLTSVTIPNSVTSIGSSAFKNCYSLTSVTINSDAIVSKDYSDASNISRIFGSQVTEYIIGDNVRGIGNSAFKDCSSLTSLTIPNSVTSIGNYAFEDCSSLTSVTIPNSVTSIGDNAFYGCSKLTSVTIPNSVTSIGYRTFYGCSSLTSVTIPNSVTSIGNSAFEDCSSLTSVTIPNSVISIGEYAFYKCSSLTSVTIGEGVRSIGHSAFYGCSSLPIENNLRYADTYLVEAVDKTLSTYSIKGGTKWIGSSAFYNCSSLTSVTIPNSVTSIGVGAFYNCSSLTSVTIGEGVRSIGNSAFYNCSSLTSVTIPNSVTSIGYETFYNCSSLTSVTIPNSVTSIGSSAFKNCSSLTSVTINSDAIVSSKDYSYDDNISDIFGSQVTEYIIGNKVKGIGSSAFYKCSSLTSVTIGESVTSIGKCAFEDCSSLTSITCEATTPPTLGIYTFYGVSKSIPVYVPCECVEAYKTASGWKDFTNIQEILLKYSIEVYVNDTIMGSAKVDYNTFCEGNQISATPNVGYHFVQWSDGNTDAIRTLELTQDTILTAEFAQSFSGQCGDDLYWNYDETAKTISITGSGKMYDFTATTQPWLLFKDQILEVTTSNTVTSIGTSAFEGCIRLSKIILGTGLEEIAANAFAGCTRLYDIYVYATYPPFAEESSFANYNVYVYIPCEYQRDYILDVVWGKFKFIECLESEDVTTDGNVIVDPGYNDVTIIWPTEGNADTYTIVIKKDGEVFCTLTFNADGQLLNIAFAPGRDGNRPAQYAEQAVNGYRFTVTGLTEATRYAYSVTTKDAANQTIATYSGEFTTKGGVATSIEDILHGTTNCQKLIRNGQLIIIRDGVEYNAVGQEIGN